MFRFVTVLTLVSVAVGSPHQRVSSSKSFSSSNRIVGGTPTTIEKRPYQVSIILNDGKDNYLCGGSILSPRYILLAAHCIPNIKKATVRAGSADLFSGGQTADAVALIGHPKYDTNTKEYDVAIIDLGSNVLKIDNKKTKLVTLAKEGTDVPAKTMITASGWGATSENGATSQRLLEVSVPVVSREECSKTYSHITLRNICAGTKAGGKDTCQGDSGGPVVLSNNNVQVGIVSYGYGCARPNTPGVYTNVASVRSWIKEKTGV